MRLATRLLLLALLVGLAACDSNDEDNVDSGTVAGSYTIETLRFASTDGRYDVNVRDTLDTSRIFVQSDTRTFNLEYQLRGSSRRTAISSSYSLSGQSITLQADKNSKEAFQRLLLPPKLRLRYNKNEPDRLTGERSNYEINLKEFDPEKYSATGVEGTLRVVLERL